MKQLARWLPILDWGRSYSRTMFAADCLAAVVVTIMLIPQSLAYAMLAGLPAQIGLYASMLPIIAYTVFGTSRSLAVGPVAVISLMTFTAASDVAAPGSAEFVAAALILAFLSGSMLLTMGIFRLGFLANLLSHPVVSGFITASAIVIATSQLKFIFGVQASGETLPQILASLASAIHGANLVTIQVGAGAIAFLFWSRRYLKPVLIRLGAPANLADLATKAAPITAVAASIGAVEVFDLKAFGVRTVGAIPQSLPPITAPLFDPGLWQQLAVPALLLSVIGFVESVSVAQTLAAKRRQRIDPDQELIGLGMANIAASFSGGYPVTGGFARSVVNFDAGAASPAAGAFTAVGIGLAALFLTPFLADLPLATLAATIVVAVLSLLDFQTIKSVWRYSRSDFSAMAATITVTVVYGVEPGVLAGAGLSLALYLWRASRPHAAIVGRVPESEHFRNIKRHKVFTDPRLLTIRIDESLTYLNARWLEEFILEQVAEEPRVRHLILMCSAVNEIDASAFESLESVAHRLHDSGVTMHFSEIKGPVMDRLKRTTLLDQIDGQVFLSQNDAWRTLLKLLDAVDAQARQMDDPEISRAMI